MSFKALRRTAATLVVSMLAVLACAAPSQAAAIGRHRPSDDSGPAQTLQKIFFSFLLQLVECAGGGVDPNGLQ